MCVVEAKVELREVQCSRQLAPKHHRQMCHPLGTQHHPRIETFCIQNETGTTLYERI